LNESIVNIILFLLGGGVVAGCTALIDFIKKGKMLKRELKSADLDNEKKELEIAKAYDEIATRAVERQMGTQERLDRLEDNYFNLKRKVEEQDVVIAEQKEIIEELTCELENNKLYNSALIQQMKDAKIIPIDIETLPIKNYNKKSKIKKTDDV
jgi:chromosome condensin MukBEF ATPase and DNA-binding subunit MukB